MDDGHSMVSRTQNPGTTRSVKAGDKIKFDVEKINGQFTVTRIKKSE
jgi:Cu(I)/Ag(I) efflux system protein CusF